MSNNPYNMDNLPIILKTERKRARLSSTKLERLLVTEINRMSLISKMAFFL